MILEEIFLRNKMKLAFVKDRKLIFIVILNICLSNVCYSQKTLEKAVFNTAITHKKTVKIESVFPCVVLNDTIDIFSLKNIDSIICTYDSVTGVKLYRLYYSNSFADSIYNRLLSKIKHESEKREQSSFWCEFKPGAFVVLDGNTLIVIQFNLCANPRLRKTIYTYLKSNSYYTYKLLMHCGYYDFEEL